MGGERQHGVQRKCGENRGGAGVRHLRFVTDAGWGLVVTAVEVSSGALDDFGTFISELQAQGFDRSDRKYLAWADANVYCGIGEVYDDDRPNTVPGLGSSNANALVAGTFGRVDNGCWGLAASVEAHELVHTLGACSPAPPTARAVSTAPTNPTACAISTERRRTVFQRCNASNDENRLDCNNEDYFHTGPPAGSYLATHWNVASSAFPSRTDPAGPVVVALAGSATTQRVMAQIATAFDGSVVQVGGSPTTVRLFNIPVSS